MFIVDAHLDLAFSALNFGRNLSLPLAEIRANEPKWARKEGSPTACVESLIAGKVGLVFGTLFVMPKSVGYAYPVVRPELCYADDAPLDYRQNQAHAIAMKQLDYYHRLADADERVRLVQSWQDVEEVRASYETENPLLGILIHMEGAEPIRDPGELEMWYERGLRSIGPAWDDTRYAPGQWREAGKLPPDGYRLLERMLQYNMICDLTHMSEAATLDVLEMYDGAICATHSNARALVPQKRQLTDTQIRLIGERNGMVGTVWFNKFLKKDHDKGDRKELVTLEHVVAQIDHICQLLGNADHVGIGTDFDGGFGAEDIPFGLDSSADMPKIAVALKEFGYEAEHIEAILHGNWLRMVRKVLGDGR